MTAWLPAIENAARLVVAIMLNSIWEDAILVFAVWLLLRALRNTNASTRYFSWLVTLIAAVVLPVITSLPQTTLGAAAPSQIVQPSAHRTQSAAPVRSAHTPAVRAAHAISAGSVAAPQRFRAPERLRVRIPSWLATVLFLTWALIAIAIGTRLSVDLYRLERLKRDSLPLPVEFRDQMERWVKAAYGNARDVRLCVSDRIEVPVAVGLFDSMILLPQHLLDQLSAGELDRISLHELAHLHRRDDWTNSVQRFAQIVMFFNPALRFIGSQLDLEREVACDDWVLSITGEVRPYATCLTKMAELTAWPHRALAAPGVFVTRKGISIRIERLLNKHRNARVKVAFAVPAAVGAALVAFFVLANVVTPVIAYTTESASSTVASVSQRIVSVTHVTHKQIAPPPVPEVATRPMPAVTPHPHIAAAHRTLVVHPAPVVHPALAAHSVTTLARAPKVYSHVASGMVQGPSSVDIPEINVHVPEQNINVHVPAVNVHVPAMHIPTDVALDSGSFTCNGCNFQNVDWSGKDMSHRSFSGSNFEHANLQGTNFSNSHLSGVNFAHANLRNANFSNASMSGCNLEGADISGAIFEGAHISGCNIDARSLNQSQLRVWLNQCSGCDFESADLHGMDLRGLHLSGISLAHANLRGADLSNTSLSGVDLSRADLTGAKLQGTHFSGCDFEHTDLRNVDLSNASLSGSDLSTAIMR